MADNNNLKFLTVAEVVLDPSWMHGLHFLPCMRRGNEHCNCDDIARHGEGGSILSFAGMYRGRCGYLPIFHACRTCDVDATIQAIITNVRGAKTWFETSIQICGVDYGVVIEEPTEENSRNLAIEMVNKYGKRD